MKILPFKESDAKAVAELSNVNSTAFQYQRVTPSFLKRMCLRSDYRMFVAKEPGQLLGFCGAKYKKGDTAELGPICVRTELRAHGIGRVLVNRIFEELEPTECSRVIVKVKSSNSEGLKFFRSMGFNKMADCTCGGAPAVVMEYLH